MFNAMRVLLVENDPVDAEVVQRLLAKSAQSAFDVQWVDSLDAGVQALAEQKFDILLLDLELPRTKELEGLERLREINSGVPIVVVTDLNVEEVALRALDHGAQDYLLKGALTTDGLVRSIHYATQRNRLVQIVADAQAVLERKNLRLAQLCRTAHQCVDNVSHEFRTPLTVIKEYVSLMRDGIVGVVSEEQRQLLSIVEDRADDLNTMVDDMLDVSRLEAGLLGVYRKQIHPADIIARVRPSLERKAAVRKVEMTWDIEDDLPAVYCDAEKAGRVLINLSINAIKFCSEPGRVTVRCRREADPPGVVLSVTDNGPGISEENQGIIFHRFEQLNSAVRSGAKGFGLGLNIANELAKLNLGEIRVSSELGHGSEFSFTLPPDDPVEVMKRYLALLGRTPTATPSLSLVRVEVPHLEVTPADEVDDFLSCLLRGNDLLVYPGGTRWLIALPDPESEIAGFRERAQKALAETNRNRLIGPLPAMNFLNLGTWLACSPSEIMARLCLELPQEELIHG